MEEKTKLWLVMISNLTLRLMILFLSVLMIVRFVAGLSFSFSIADLQYEFFSSLQRPTGGI